MSQAATANRRLAIFAAGILIIGIAWLAPLPPPIVSDGETVALTQAGKLCIGILGMIILFWVTEILPFAVTGFLGIVLLHAFGVQDFSVILAKGFGHPIATFIIGILLFSMAVTSTGLGNRITRAILTRVGGNTRRILFGILAVGAFLSAWMSDTAVAAILLPIGVGILRAEGLQPLKSNFGKALMIACVWGPSIGGIATPAGAAPNPITLGFLQQMAGEERTFFDWMILGVPAAIILLPISWFLLVRIFPPEMEFLSESSLPDQNEKFPMTRGEWTTIFVFLLTVTLWIATPWIQRTTGLKLSMEYVIFATVLIFFLPKLDVLTWPQVHKEFSWSALFLVMTGISIGFVVGDSGVAEWLSYLLLKPAGELPLYVMLVATAVAVTGLHNFFASNTITAVVMVPIVLQTALLMELPPWLAVAPAAFSSTMGLILVTSAPTNLIPYTAGYFSIRDFAKAGICIWLIGSVVIGSVVYLMHVIFGIS